MRTIPSIFAILFTATTAALLATGSPSPRPQEPVNPVLKKFGNAIVFYAGFEGTTAAEVSSGDSEPRKTKWSPGDDSYVPGFIGKTLKDLSYHMLTYDLGENFHIDRPGCALAWVAIAKRQSHFGYWWPMRVNAEATLLMGRMGGEPNQEMMYAAFVTGGGGTVLGSSVMGSALKWADGEWHLVVANWQSEWIEFSVDGETPQRAKLKTNLPEASTSTRASVCLGSEDKDEKFEFLIDEPMVLNIPLKAEDIKWIYTECTKK